jgi:hypothetical protein
MVNQINQEQINDQINQLKKLTEKTTNPAVNIYIIMALRQLVKVLTLNEHNKFKVWRVNKAIECLCTATKLSQCTQEIKNEITAVTCQIEQNKLLWHI